MQNTYIIDEHTYAYDHMTVTKALHTYTFMCIRGAKYEKNVIKGRYHRLTHA